jgi:hypothetical protein
VSGGERHLVEPGTGCGLPDGADRRCRRDVVLVADEIQDRHVDVGEGHRVVPDGEAAREHPVVHEELAYELGHRGTWPGHPALTHEEAALALPGQQRLPVVQLPDEVEALAQHVHVDGEGGGRDGDRFRQSERERSPQVDRAAEGDQAGDALATPVGRGLIAEHAALGVAGERDVTSGHGTDPVDGGADREDVVGEGALGAAHLPLRGAEVDHPRIDAGGQQDLDGTALRRDVVDLGGQHQRWDQQDGRRVAAIGHAGALVVAQPVHRVARNYPVGTGLLPGIETAEPCHLDGVLRCRTERRQRLAEERRDQTHADHPFARRLRPRRRSARGRVRGGRQRHDETLRHRGLHFVRRQIRVEHPGHLIGEQVPVQPALHPLHRQQDTEQAAGKQQSENPQQERQTPRFSGYDRLETRCSLVGDGAVARRI